MILASGLPASSQGNLNVRFFTAKANPGRRARCDSWEGLGAYKGPSQQVAAAKKKLYHYPDSGGFKGIIESGALRATHIAFMNDSSEYLHAVSLLLDDVRAAKKHVSANSLQGKLLEEMEPAISGTRPEDVSPYFVACFSAQENSLNQWRA
jgi:hypothetical protein